jgi:hypothetical protein
MAANGVDVDSVGVDLKVDPIEYKGLGKTENAFAEEGVDTEVGTVLEEDGKYGLAEDESDKSVVALDTMLNINRWAAE